MEIPASGREKDKEATYEFSSTYRRRANSRLACWAGHERWWIWSIGRHYSWILGGFLGGWLFGQLGIWPGGGMIGSIIVAFVGAVILAGLCG